MDFTDKLYKVGTSIEVMYPNSILKPDRITKGSLLWICGIRGFVIDAGVLFTNYDTIIERIGISGKQRIDRREVTIATGIIRSVIPKDAILTINMDAIKSSNYMDIEKMPPQAFAYWCMAQILFTDHVAHVVEMSYLKAGKLNGTLSELKKLERMQKFKVKEVVKAMIKDMVDPKSIVSFICDNKVAITAEILLLKALFAKEFSQRYLLSVLNRVGNVFSANKLSLTNEVEISDKESILRSIMGLRFVDSNIANLIKLDPNIVYKNLEMI